MSLLLTTDILYMIGEFVLSGVTWTDGSTRVYDEVWYDTGCSLSTTNRLFAQVIQPLLFRCITLQDTIQAKRFYALVSQRPRFADYVVTLAITNISGRIFHHLDTHLSSSSSWATWFCSKQGIALIAQLTRTSKLIIKDWGAAAHQRSSKAYRVLSSISASLMQISHLRSIKFEDCYFHALREPLSWTLRCNSRKSITIFIGKSNQISDNPHHWPNTGTDTGLSRPAQISLHVDWCQLHHMTAAQLDAFDETSKIYVVVTSLLCDLRFPIKLSSNELSQTVRDFLNNIASLKVALITLRGIYHGHVPNQSWNTNVAECSDGRPSHRVIKMQYEIWHIMDEILSGPAMFNSRAQIVIAIDYPIYEHHGKWEATMQQLLPAVHNMGRLSVVRDDFEYLW